MKLTEEQEEQIVNCGVFNYSIEKIANILGMNVREIENDEKIKFLLQIGKDRADYLVDLKLFELAKNGDLKALEIFNKRKRIRK